jgi:UDP-N-acetylglucosamine:LPS N-acetylglucosamine transferase
MTKKKIIIATGGTGGHVFPAYSLANSLMKNYSVLLTSDKRGLNYLKNYKNLNLENISSSPLEKKKFIYICIFYCQNYLFNLKVFFIFNI